MKIVIIANDSNGLYLFRRQLIGELIAKGNQVTALIPFDSDVEKLKALGAVLHETPINRRGTNPFEDFALLKMYKSELERIKPDFVITYTIKPNVYGGIASRQLSISYAANITGLGTAFEGNGLLKKVAVVLNKVALKKAKVVFFENKDNRDTFVRERIVSQKKTYVLHGAGVDLEYFVYQTYPQNKVFHFLFIGRVMKEKGVDELLSAMRRLINEGEACCLDILGHYEENYKEKLESAQKEGWLHYHGNQPDVRPYIATSDCFVLPSYHEGMANTNLECAASGRPIITSNIAGCREAVVDGESGLLCESKNVENLYHAMKKMIAIPVAQRQMMGKAGRKHMEAYFNKKEVVKQTVEVLLG